MKSNFKKVMSIVLTVLMVMTVVPFTGLAADCEHEYTYAYDSDGYHTYRCTKCTDRGFEKCSGGTATCKDKAVCEKCETAYGELSTVHGETKIDTKEENLKSAATCQSPAIYFYVCKVCGGNTEDTFEFGDVDPDGHVYDKATKNEDLPGTHSAVCSLCQNDVKSANCFDEEPNVIAPTCTTPGKTENECNACGYKWDSEPTDALGHSFTEQIKDEAHLKSAATCTAKATYWYDCAACDVMATEETAADKYYEDGEMLPHVYDKEVAEEKYIVTAATCQQNAVYYTSCVCGKAGTDVFTGAKGTHTWGTYVYNNDAKCGVDGTKTASCTISGCDKKDTITAEGTALEHIFTEEIADETHLKDAATCTKKATYWKECSREGCAVLASDETVAANYFESGELAAHSFTEQIKDDAHLKAAATCATKAVYWYDCASCDAIASDDKVESNYYTDEESELLPHKYELQTVKEEYLAVAATCSTKAIYYKSCACGASGKDSEVEVVFESGEALGHIVETIPGKDPTCTEDGYTESRVCKRPTADGKTCGAVLKAQVKRPATGHKEYVSVEKVEATCVKVGHSEEKKCAVCEQLLTLPSITSPALGHTDADGDELCDRAGCGTIISVDDTCSCLCHQTGFMKVVYILVRLIWKLIGANPYCDCGVEHY
ncbi:MAG: hypothetical protein IJW86_04740 [Clostridia bacterium]|nr:hypothetical protein [Clostridia bacterium]